jgi:hypothetical protein
MKQEAFVKKMVGLSTIFIAQLIMFCRSSLIVISLLPSSNDVLLLNPISSIVSCHMYDQVV